MTSKRIWTQANEIEVHKKIQKICEKCSERSDCYLKRIAEAVHEVYD